MPVNVTDVFILNAVPLDGVENVMPDVYLDGLGCRVTSRVGAGYGNGVDATGAATSAFGTQPDVVFINELPVWRSITVTRSVNSARCS